jgi:hypothetical protein
MLVPTGKTAQAWRPRAGKRFQENVKSFTFCAIRADFFQKLFPSQNLVAAAVSDEFSSIKLFV